MIEITDTVYRVVAARLREQIATAEWFNGVIELPPAAPAPSAASPKATPLLQEGGVPPLAGGGVVGLSDGAPAPHDFDGRLTLSAIIYRRTEVYPEGVCRPISDVVPVWWEFSTVRGGEIEINDFCFSELRPYLIDCE